LFLRGSGEVLKKVREDGAPINEPRKFRNQSTMGNSFKPDRGIRTSKQKRAGGGRVGKRR